MSYLLRDRPDGQVEIVLFRPVLIGTFPERDVAERVYAFLKHDEPALPDDAPASFSKANADVHEAEGASLAEILPDDLKPLAEKVAEPVRNLPALTPEKPQAPVFLTPPVGRLTEEQRETAFRRIADGQKIGDIAPEYGLTMGQLRAMWAHHRRMLQRHLAEGGPVACRLCERPFTPSVMHPDTCARCSHE